MSPPLPGRAGTGPTNGISSEVGNRGNSPPKTNGNTVATNGYPAGTRHPGCGDKLQCYRKACGGSFTNSRSWREHNKICTLVGNSGYCCVFPDCPEDFMTFSLHDMVTHQCAHQIFVCYAQGCASVFPTQDGAIKHVIKEHPMAKPPTDMIKHSWTAQKHEGEFQRQSGVCFDISDVILSWRAGVSSPPEDIRPALELAPYAFPGNRHPESGANAEDVEDAQSLSSAVFAHIAHQLATLGDLLDNRALVPTAMEYRQVSQALGIMQERLNGKPFVSQSAGWNKNFAFPGGASGANGLRRPETFQEEAPATATAASLGAHEGPKHQKKKSAAAQVSTMISPVQEEGGSGDLSGTDLSSDEEPDLRMQGTDGEPLQHTHLSGKEQSKYFQQMQQCCVRAAHEFYLRHRAHLDNIKDKKSRQLCLTAKSNPICKPEDLSLPHWTHLLRRISDARGLQKNMVSRIESFNGDISPVDEVRHAFTKNKVKSDRDLLALVQLTRNFCWQLKDWDRCGDLDTLYTLLEKTIREAKRRKLEGYSKPSRKGTFSSRRERPTRSPQRQSATWPLMVEIEGVE